MSFSRGVIFIQATALKSRTIADMKNETLGSFRKKTLLQVYVTILFGNYEFSGSYMDLGRLSENCFVCQISCSNQDKIRLF